MEFIKTSKIYSLNKFTYVNLRWIGIIGQFVTIVFFAYMISTIGDLVKEISDI